MDNFPGTQSVVDTLAFREATEAVIGVTLQGERPDRENVLAWLKAASDEKHPHPGLHGRAMYFVGRMINGPLFPERPPIST